MIDRTELAKTGPVDFETPPRLPRKQCILQEWTCCRSTEVGSRVDGETRTSWVSKNSIYWGSFVTALVFTRKFTGISTITRKVDHTTITGTGLKKNLNTEKVAQPVFGCLQD